MALVSKTRPDVKLLFMGTYKPENRSSAELMTARAQALAKDLHLLNRHVFFQEGWVTYEERSKYLAESDIAVCLAPESQENTFSYRTRLMDAVWADLPMVCTRGGFMADWIERNHAGITVEGRNTEAAAQAILRALDAETNHKFRESIKLNKAPFRWSTCTEPLVEFCSRIAAEGMSNGKKKTGWIHYAEYKLLAAWQRLLRTS